MQRSFDKAELDNHRQRKHSEPQADMEAEDVQDVHLFSSCIVSHLPAKTASAKKRYLQTTELLFNFGFSSWRNNEEGEKIYGN